MSGDVGESPDDSLPVHFGDPLWSQRLAWVLGQLRQASARTILDLGCGEGTLLRFLTEPANVIYDETSVPNPDVSSRLLHPYLLAGIDVDDRSLEHAIAVTTPRAYTSDAPRWITGTPRWDELKVEVWKGDLTVLNDMFLDRFECFVSTEVVEHLPADVLAQFFPVVLGYYRPPILLLTTPNYDFNALFTVPGGKSSGHLDPTGETDRIFRHHDHKREWTVAEWRSWCEAGAKKFGYEVILGAVGAPQEEDPYGRSVHVLGKASQTAVFRRIEDRERVRPPSLGTSSSSEPHSLLVEHLYQAHPSAGKPLSAGDIRERVKTVISSSDTSELGVEELWLSEDIDVACGGSIKTLLEALLQSTSDNSEPEWEITEAGAEAWNWLVLWKNWVPPDGNVSRNVWEDPLSEEEIAEAQSAFAQFTPWPAHATVDGW